MSRELSMDEVTELGRGEDNTIYHVNIYTDFDKSIIVTFLDGPLAGKTIKSFDLEG